MRLSLSLILIVACTTAFAGQVKMPTQAEMKEARSAIRDLVSTGTSISELMSLADETNSGAEKYCLYVEVFKAQAKKEQYADAAETIKRIKEEISGVPESEIVKLIDQYAGKSGNEIPELKAIYQLAHSKMKAEKFVSQIKVELNKNPKDQYLQKSLGEALAISGDWENALTEFAKCDDEVSARAKAEVKGELNGKLAAFWWEYKADKRFGETGAFKAHAAELYAKLMDGDKLSVIERKVAEKRVSYVEEFAEVEPSKESSTSELAKLKRICNTKGLLHCWRFNGNTKDCVGNKDAQLNGNVKLEDGQAVLKGGRELSHVYLGDHIIPNDGSSVTIEIWATQNQVQNWSRVFALGDNSDYRIEQTWSCRRDAMRESFAITFAGEKDTYDYDKVGPFDLGREYHLAFVLEHDKSGSLVAMRYKQDGKTGATIRSVPMLTSGPSLRRLSQMKMWLGHSFFFEAHGDCDASASYNEVRIWNRALSEKELTQNAIKFHKAGETSKGSVAIRKESKSSSSKSTAFGTLIE